MSPNITSLPVIGSALTPQLLERYRIEDIQQSLTPKGTDLELLTTFNLVDRQTGHRLSNFRWSLEPVILPMNGFACAWTNQQMTQQAMVGGGASQVARTTASRTTGKARARAVGSRIQT